MKGIKIHDISRPIGRGEAVYPGNEAPALKRIKVFSKDKSNLFSLSLGLHTASHLDAPLHYIRNGKTADKLSLEKCVGWCRVVNFENIKREIGETEIKRVKPKAEEIILFKTKNSKLSASKRFNKNFVYLNESGARFLVKSRIKAVGIDGPSIRKFRLKPDTVHPILLKAGIGVYEGLYFRDVKPGRYFFIGLPLKIKDAEASPVRAILIK
ncbi:MAG: cyclase family protein [Candidatus Liptonbacteria bacterium]|nr:cyclase family protein [Candidatus Liptonbacteria bacterium]